MSEAFDCLLVAAARLKLQLARSRSGAGGVALVHDDKLLALVLVAGLSGGEEAAQHAHDGQALCLAEDATAAAETENNLVRKVLGNRSWCNLPAGVLIAILLLLLLLLLLTGTGHVEGHRVELLDGEHLAEVAVVVATRLHHVVVAVGRQSVREKEVVEHLVHVQLPGRRTIGQRGVCVRLGDIQVLGHRVMLLAVIVVRVHLGGPIL